MSVQLNHTIVRVRDKQVSASFLTDILGLPAPTSYGPFHAVQLENGATLDYAETHGTVVAQHYAFLVGDGEFNQILGRIRERGLPFWADPSHRRRDEINTNDGGRGLYWDDPDGHSLEILTRPYGSGG